MKQMTDVATVYRDSVGEWRWRYERRARGRNNIMADSGEGYGSPGACKRALKSVMANLGGAQIVVESGEKDAGE